MIFGRLGELAAKRAPFLAGAWLIVLILSVSLSPEWTSVIQNGEFAFLPETSPSRQAEANFRSAFPDDVLASSLVLVVRRESSADGLTDADRAFISDVLVPDLHQLIGIPMREKNVRNESGDSEATADANRVRSSSGSSSAVTQARAGVTRDLAEMVHLIQWFEDARIGDLLVSDDRHASLVVVQLTTEFLDQANRQLVDAVERYLRQLIRIPVGQDGRAIIPAGLDVAVSGSATFGRDMIRESLDSARSTEKWTVILVIILLIVIYRAPLLALIPLITVATSTSVAINLLAIGASLNWCSLFNGIETYVTVIVYGAGIDNGLFLMARYREELDDGATIEEAVAKTLQFVGPALAASAGTTIFGIGMMLFAEFGKFRQAGFAITFGLMICLIASLTLTPAIVRLFGRYAFWPGLAATGSRRETGFLLQSSWMNRLQRADVMGAGWRGLAGLIERRPGTLWLLSVLGLFPFSVIGVLFTGFLSYGLLSELPRESTSVLGTAAVQAHFPAGEVGPVSLLLKSPGVDFGSKNSISSENLIRSLTDRLVEEKDRLGLYSIRSLSHPKGQRPEPRISVLQKTGQRKLARDYYVSKQDPSVCRIDLIFKMDPFSRSSIEEFRTLRDALPEMLPPELKGSEISFVGPTPNISDLKDVTDGDQIRIDVLVLISVYAVLVVLLRRPGICGYLIISVFYSYLATLGITFFAFWALDPSGFSGIDWKVPLFLFTILIAVGEDYNIFLMSRVEEEQKRHGPVHGITVALERTGSIISSCGIIMAGTFSALMAGSLVGMDQLGLALTVGVLIDTFVVRPVMVPAFLVLLVQGRLWIFSRLAGYPPAIAAVSPSISAEQSSEAIADGVADNSRQQ
ncbi:MAG: MMPL family transporter [Planctomyces sp.]|jgi:RND superfamily putative drug exporter